MVEACSRWQPKAASTNFRSAFRSEVPVFMVRGALSPTSASGFATELSKNFDVSSVLTLPNSGFDVRHDVPVCVDELRRSFLIDPTTPLGPAELEACEAQSPPVAFLTG